jgi:site-specific DNA recombinase
MPTTATPATVPTAALYVRVSTDDQVEKYGLDAQRADMRALAARRGYRVTTEYRDDGYSGATSQRPALARLRADLAAGPPFGVLLIPEVDRLARDLALQLALVQEIEKAGVRIEWKTGPRDTSTNGRAFEQMRGVFAEMERGIIRERTMRGKLAKAEQGRFVCGRAPFGYRLDPQAPSGLAVHAGEAAIVRRIFRWAAVEGQSTREIVRALREHGVAFGRSTVKRVLGNSTYTGRAYYNVFRRAGATRTRRDRADWKEIRVPAIVDAAMFDRARARLAANRTERVGRPPAAVYVLRGLLTCECGRRMGGNTGRRGRAEYRCNGRDVVGNRPGAPRCGRTVRADRIEPAVWSTVLDMFGTRQGLADVLADYHEAAGSRETDARAMVATTTRELADVARRIDRHLDLYEAMQDATPEAVKGRLADLEAKRKALTAQLVRAQAAVADVDTSNAQAADVEAMARRLARTARRITDPAERRAFLHRFVQAVIYGPAGVVVRGTLTVGDVETTGRKLDRPR